MYEYTVYCTCNFSYEYIVTVCWYEYCIELNEWKSLNLGYELFT